MGEIELSTIQVYAQEVVPESLLVGIQQPEVFLRRDVFGNLVAQVNGFVMAEDAGEPVGRSCHPEFIVERKVRPRWIPKWLWNRINEELVTERRTYTLVVTPKWTYPSANVKVPILGKPIRFADGGDVRQRWDESAMNQNQQTKGEW